MERANAGNLQHGIEVVEMLINKTHNKALHQSAIPLRSIAAGELGRCAALFKGDKN